MKFQVCTILVSAILMMGNTVLAQHHGHSMYAGQEERAIKSLSEKDINDIKKGNGWGLAKIAELSGFPGPKHVLDLQEQLKLTEAQIESTMMVYKQMREEAIQKGAAFLEAERDLQQVFDDDDVTKRNIQELILKSAIARGELREVHMVAHLKMMEILDHDQIAKYNELRGY